MKSAAKKIMAFVLAFAMVLPTFTLNVTEAVMAAGTVTFTESGGWFESAYAKWKPVEGATGYKAYVKEASAADTAYVQLDNELLRQYADYWRADQVGLKAGSYVMKIEAVDASGKVINDAVTETLSVKAYDRTGFAWVKDAKGNATASGAYNEDGTLKDNAVVIYLTEATKDNLNAQIITSSDGSKTTCKTVLELMAAIKKAQETRPVDIRIIGQVTDVEGIDKDKDAKGDLTFETNNRAYGLTIEGIGDDATADGWGIRLQKATNVEIRNIAFINCNSKEGDNVGLQQDNDHIWVHNCDMFYGHAGTDSDQVKGDGALDCKGSTYVTFSYNHFVDNGKSNLLGLNAEAPEGYYITYHHNWYDHSDSRHPRVRFYSVHVYNNYYDGNAKYGIGACLGSSIFADSNYFRNCRYPMLVSMQGSEVYSGSNFNGGGTLSSEAGGTIKAFNNIMTGKYNFIAYGSDSYIDNGVEKAFNLTGTNSSLDFDAYVVNSADEKVPDSVKANLGAVKNNNKSLASSTESANKANLAAYGEGNIYNNFDTNSDIMYSYNADAAENVPEIVKSNAGRMNGGEIKWTFTEKDDTSGDVNKELKSYITSYKSSLVSIGGVNGTKFEVRVPEAEKPLTGNGAGVEDKPVDDTYILNADNMTSGDIVESVKAGTSGFYTISASSANKVTVDTSSKKIGTLTIEHRIKLSGTGASDGSYRTINFATSSEGTFSIYMMASSSSATREVNFYKDGEVIKTVSVGGSSLTEYKFDLPGAGKYVLASKSGGVNVYYATVKAKADAGSVNGSGNNGNTSDKVKDGWNVIDGKEYWYESGVRQGTEGRGKEICDPATNIWYWLDAVQSGAKTVSKDVYQESLAGICADDMEKGTGKWVRYDASGHMIKGWCTGIAESAKVINSPKEAGDSDVYYFDMIYGTMVKGYYTVDGTEYYFNTTTGVLEKEVVSGLKDFTGWKKAGNDEFWYENGQRQGVSANSSYRGKEIFDPASNAWYWLDNVDAGKKAVSKDVYQESLAGEWGDTKNSAGEKIGKWVRYDADGHMIKGWSQDHKYYFDLTYGTMAKGSAMIDGKIYTFDSATGLLKN